MKASVCARSIFLITCCAGVAAAQEAAETQPETAEPKQEELIEEEATEYAQAGTIELGGSVSLFWTEESFNVDMSPEVGYFVIDNVELSLIFRLSYWNEEDAETGSRHSHKRYSLLLEPSYHAPLSERLYLLGGLGIGVGHDSDNMDFEIVPRVGLDIAFNRGSLLTPALRAPILIDSDGTTVGVGFEIGYAYAW